MEHTIPKRILTGDRPTGLLHIGHFIGSLQNRVLLQEKSEQFVLIADMQAMTDNAGDTTKVANAVGELVKDYLAVGIDPKKTTICLQSELPALCELTMYYLNLVSVSRLQQNPTVKDEIAQKGFGNQIPAGFFIYPVSQAADITAFKADGVPVGNDQLPMIEQTNEIVRKFNRDYDTDVLVETQAILSDTPRLSGIDGNSKMSKSLKNAIFLNDSEKEIQEKIYTAYTDPNHIHVEDPGRTEGNVVFEYLDIFDTNKKEVKHLKEQYRRGGLGDVVVKKYLTEVINDMLTPIRKKRKKISKKEISDVLKKGTKHAQEISSHTLQEVKKALGVYKIEE